jgi:hypothetical protein
MISMAFLAALLAGAAQPTPTTAAQSAAAPSAAAPTATNSDAEKKICRRVVVTGAITARRVCHTQQEWNAMAAAGEDNARRLQDRPNAGMSPGN